MVHNTVKKFSAIHDCHFITCMSRCAQSCRRTSSGKWVWFIESHIHSFHWHVRNAKIPCRTLELLPFPLCYVLFPATLLHQLFFHPLSSHLTIYFLVCLSILLFPNSYTRAVQKVSDLNFFRLNKSSTGSVLHCGCGGDIYAHA